MAQVIGKLRDEATNGEILVLKRLKENLPNDFTIYVETPIYLQRKDSNPDFIVLTNYGFIVLEVKDWNNFQNINKHSATRETKSGPIKHRNPVSQARGFAIDIVNSISKLANKNQISPAPNVPYGYAVVLPYLAGYLKKQVQTIWGESFIFNNEDLQFHVIKQRLKNTIRADKINPISREVMDLVRGAIYPEITFDGGILNEEQSSIVLEPQIKEVEKSPKLDKKPTAPPINVPLFEEISQKIPLEDQLPTGSERIIESNQIRLVRGVMGSGKTLVLLAKAKHWAKTNPNWKILVLAFNKELAKTLKKELKAHQNIHTTNLHEFIVSQITTQNKFLTKTKIDTLSWVENHKNKFDIIEELGTDFISKELGWMQDVMINSREEYINIKRVGRGNQPSITKIHRERIFDLFENHLKIMKENRQVSWEQLVIEYLYYVNNDIIFSPKFDAILIDEAQDFAPSWIAVVNKLLKPNANLFMVDDPTQSIFRYFSWKRKGVDVRGKTTKLRVPYRNTLEIYSAATSIVKDDPVLLAQLKIEGEEFIPEEELSSMRRGKKPLLVTHKEALKDVSFIESQMQFFKQEKKIEFDRMCVILPDGKDIHRFNKALSKYGIKIITSNQVKGLTYDVVFLCGLDNYFRGNNEDLLYVSSQKRLIHSAMGRAKTHLFLLHQKKFSSYLEPLREHTEPFNFE